MFCKMVPPREFIDFVQDRGYTATPITNSQAAFEGADLRIMGYELRGPRGNRQIIPKDRDGLLPIDQAALWCDGVDYSTRKIRNRRRF